MATTIFNMSRELITIDGKPLTKSNVDDEIMTLGKVSVNALMFMDGNDVKKIGGKEKVERFELAMRLNKGGEQELSSEQIVLVKGLIDSCYGPAVVGPSWILLDQKEQNV